MGPDRIAQILLRERVRLTAVAMSLVRNAHTAEDVFQEVLVRALEGRANVETPAHAISWGMKAIRNRCIDILREKHGTSMPEDAIAALKVEWPEVTAESSDNEAIALKRCMDKLADSARKILRFKYEDGLSVRDIAGRLNRSEEAIYQSLYRIHRALRGCVSFELIRQESRSEVSW